jgi:hypothetical protein
MVSGVDHAVNVGGLPNTPSEAQMELDSLRLQVEQWKKKGAYTIGGDVERKRHASNSPTSDGEHEETAAASKKRPHKKGGNGGKGGKGAGDPIKKCASELATKGASEIHRKQTVEAHRLSISMVQAPVPVVECRINTRSLAHPPHKPASKSATPVPASKRPSVPTTTTPSSILKSAPVHADKSEAGGKVKGTPKPKSGGKVAVTGSLKTSTVVDAQSFHDLLASHSKTAGVHGCGVNV